MSSAPEDISDPNSNLSTNGSLNEGGNKFDNNVLTPTSSANKDMDEIILLKSAVENPDVPTITFAKGANPLKQLHQLVHSPFLQSDNIAVDSGLEQNIAADSVTTNSGVEPSQVRTGNVLVDGEYNVNLKSNEFPIVSNNLRNNMKKITKKTKNTNIRNKDNISAIPSNEFGTEKPILECLLKSPNHFQTNYKKNDMEVTVEPLCNSGSRMGQVVRNSVNKRSKKLSNKSANIEISNNKRGFMELTEIYGKKSVSDCSDDLLYIVNDDNKKKKYKTHDNKPTSEMRIPPALTVIPRGNIINPKSSSNLLRSPPPMVPIEKISNLRLPLQEDPLINRLKRLGTDIEIEKTDESRSHTMSSQLMRNLYVSSPSHMLPFPLSSLPQLKHINPPFSNKSISLTKLHPPPGLIPIQSCSLPFKPVSNTASSSVEIAGIYKADSNHSDIPQLNEEDDDCIMDKLEITFGADDTDQEVTIKMEPSKINPYANDMLDEVTIHAIPSNPLMGCQKSNLSAFCRNNKDVPAQRYRPILPLPPGATRHQFSGKLTQSHDRKSVNDLYFMFDARLIEKCTSFLPDGQKMYNCDICTESYHKLYTLKKHYFRSHINYKYVYHTDARKYAVSLEEIVKSTFRDKSQIISNSSSNSNEKSGTIFSGLYHCQICGIKFDNKYELKSHLIDHPPVVVARVSSDKSYDCPNCHMIFLKKRPYLNHLVACEMRIKIGPMVQQESIKMEPPIIKMEPPIIRMEPPIIRMEPPIIRMEPPIIKMEPPIIKMEPPIIKMEPPIIKMEPPIIRMPQEHNIVTLPVQSHALTSNKSDIEIMHENNKVEPSEPMEGVVSQQMEVAPLSELVEVVKKNSQRNSPLLNNDSLKNTEKFLCLFCDESFLDNGSKKRHNLRAHHPKKKIHTCYLCKCKKSLTEVLKHLCIVHDKKYFGCIPCRMRFSSKKILSQHITEVHKKIGTVIRKKIGNKNQKNAPCNVVKHEQLRRTRRFTCKECSRIFTNNVILGRHMRSDHSSESSKEVRSSERTLCTNNNSKHDDTIEKPQVDNIPSILYFKRVDELVKINLLYFMGESINSQQPAEYKKVKSDESLGSIYDRIYVDNLKVKTPPVSEYQYTPIAVKLASGWEQDYNALFNPRKTLNFIDLYGIENFNETFINKISILEFTTQLAMLHKMDKFKFPSADSSNSVDTTISTSVSDTTAVASPEDDNNSEDCVHQVEFSGEFSYPHKYICMVCHTHFNRLRDFEDHCVLKHPNVMCVNYTFPVDQTPGYAWAMKHTLLRIGTLGISTSAFDELQSVISCPNICTKCNKSVTPSPEFHKHILECGGDTTWTSTMFPSLNPRKSRRYNRPFGSRRRPTEARVRGLKRTIQTPTKPEAPTHPFPRPYKKAGDADTIQRMIANLPPKRITRRAIMFDEISQVHTVRAYRKRKKESELITSDVKDDENEVETTVRSFKRGRKPLLGKEKEKGKLDSNNESENKVGAEILQIPEPTLEDTESKTTDVIQKSDETWLIESYDTISDVDESNVKTSISDVGLDSTKLIDLSESIDSPKSIDSNYAPSNGDKMFVGETCQDSILCDDVMNTNNADSVHQILGIQSNYGTCNKCNNDLKITDSDGLCYQCIEQKCVILKGLSPVKSRNDVKTQTSDDEIDDKDTKSGEICTESEKSGSSLTNDKPRTATRRPQREVICVNCNNSFKTRGRLNICRKCLDSFAHRRKVREAKNTFAVNEPGYKNVNCCTTSVNTDVTMYDVKPDTIRSPSVTQVLPNQVCPLPIPNLIFKDVEIDKIPAIPETMLFPSLDTIDAIDGNNKADMELLKLEPLPLEDVSSTNSVEQKIEEVNSEDDTRIPNIVVLVPEVAETTFSAVKNAEIFLDSEVNKSETVECKTSKSDSPEESVIEEGKSSIDCTICHNTFIGDPNLEQFCFNCFPSTTKAETIEVVSTPIIIQAKMLNTTHNFRSNGSGVFIEKPNTSASSNPLSQTDNHQYPNVYKIFCICSLCQKVFENSALTKQTCDACESEDNEKSADKEVKIHTIIIICEICGKHYENNNLTKQFCDSCSRDLLIMSSHLVQKQEIVTDEKVNTSIDEEIDISTGEKIDMSIDRKINTSTSEKMDISANNKIKDEKFGISIDEKIGTSMDEKINTSIDEKINTSVKNLGLDHVPKISEEQKNKNVHTKSMGKTITTLGFKHCIVCNNKYLGFSNGGPFCDNCKINRTSYDSKTCTLRTNISNCNNTERNTLIPTYRVPSNVLYSTAIYTCISCFNDVYCGKFMLRRLCKLCLLGNKADTNIATEHNNSSGANISELKDSANHSQTSDVKNNICGIPCLICDKYGIMSHYTICPICLPLIDIKDNELIRNLIQKLHSRPSETDSVDTRVKHKPLTDNHGSTLTSLDSATFTSEEESKSQIQCYHISSSNSVLTGAEELTNDCATEDVVKVENTSILEISSTGTSSDAIQTLDVTQALPEAGTLPAEAKGPTKIVILVCKVCREGFSTVSSYKQHCSNCKFKDLQSDDKKSQEKSPSTKGSVMEQVSIPRTVDPISSFEIHSKVFNATDPLICEVCKLSFNNISLYKQHCDNCKLKDLQNLDTNQQELFVLGNSASVEPAQLNKIAADANISKSSLMMKLIAEPYSSNITEPTTNKSVPNIPETPQIGDLSSDLIDSKFTLMVNVTENQDSFISNDDIVLKNIQVIHESVDEITRSTKFGRRISSIESIIESIEAVVQKFQEDDINETDMKLNFNDTLKMSKLNLNLSSDKCNNNASSNRLPGYIEENEEIKYEPNDSCWEITNNDNFVPNVKKEPLEYYEGDIDCVDHEHGSLKMKFKRSLKNGEIHVKQEMIEPEKKKRISVQNRKSKNNGVKIGIDTSSKPSGENQHILNNILNNLESVPSKSGIKNMSESSDVLMTEPNVTFLPEICIKEVEDRNHDLCNTSISNNKKRKRRANCNILNDNLTKMKCGKLLHEPGVDGKTQTLLNKPARPRNQTKKYAKNSAQLQFIKNVELGQLTTNANVTQHISNDDTKKLLPSNIAETPESSELSSHLMLCNLVKKRPYRKRGASVSLNSEISSNKSNLYLLTSDGDFKLPLSPKMIEDGVVKTKYRRQSVEEIQHDFPFVDNTGTPQQIGKMDTLDTRIVKKRVYRRNSENRICAKLDQEIVSPMILKQEGLEEIKSPPSCVIQSPNDGFPRKKRQYRKRLTVSINAAESPEINLPHSSSLSSMPKLEERNDQIDLSSLSVPTKRQYRRQVSTITNCKSDDKIANSSPLCVMENDTANTEDDNTKSKISELNVVKEKRRRKLKNLELIDGKTDDNDLSSNMMIKSDNKTVIENNKLAKGKKLNLIARSANHTTVKAVTDSTFKMRKIKTKFNHSKNVKRSLRTKATLEICDTNYAENTLNDELKFKQTKVAECASESEMKDEFTQNFKKESESEHDCTTTKKQKVNNDAKAKLLQNSRSRKKEVANKNFVARKLLVGRQHTKKNGFPRTVSNKCNKRIIALGNNDKSKISGTDISKKSETKKYVCEKCSFTSELLPNFENHTCDEFKTTFSINSDLYDARNNSAEYQDKLKSNLDGSGIFKDYSIQNGSLLNQEERVTRSSINSTMPIDTIKIDLDVTEHSFVESLIQRYRNEVGEATAELAVLQQLKNGTFMLNGIALHNSFEKEEENSLHSEDSNNQNENGSENNLTMGLTRKRSLRLKKTKGSEEIPRIWEQNRASQRRIASPSNTDQGNNLRNTMATNLDSVLSKVFNHILESPTGSKQVRKNVALKLLNLLKKRPKNIGMSPDLQNVILQKTASDNLQDAHPSSQHSSSNDANENVYLCPICNMEFQFTCERNKHLTRNHSVIGDKRLARNNLVTSDKIELSSAGTSLKANNDKFGESVEQYEGEKPNMAEDIDNEHLNNYATDEVEDANAGNAEGVTELQNISRRVSKRRASLAISGNSSREIRAKAQKALLELKLNRSARTID